MYDSVEVPRSPRVRYLILYVYTGMYGMCKECRMEVFVMRKDFQLMFAYTRVHRYNT